MPDEEQPIPFAENVRLQWIVIAVIVLIPFVIFYAVENPTSNVAMVLFIEPSYTKVKKGLPIIDEFNSYVSLDDLTYDLTYKHYQYSVSNKNLSQGQKKPYELNTVSVRNYVHLDQPGELALTLFNDRLSYAVFYPYDEEAYKEEIDHSLKRALKFNETRHLNPYISLHYGKDLDGRFFFRWEDRRLVTEELAWRMRHS